MQNDKKIKKKKKTDESSKPIIESILDDDVNSGLKEIIIRGGREHNLKNIDVNIPRDKFIVITGISGSGKSSLAFDTLYAEGQRRYVECLSAYSRQFLGVMKKPKVDRIEGLSPAISIEQKSLGHNPRSTVGTVTEIYDYLRLLFAKIGVQYCVDCKIPVQQKTLDQIVEETFIQFKDKKIQILAPLVKARKGHYRELFEQLMKLGFTRVRVDGVIREIKPEMQVERYKIHDIELVVDRCVVNNSQEHRISESIELALSRGEGTMMLLIEEESGKWDEKLYSTAYSCPSCGRAYEMLAPNMFSFNSPYGACTKCQGLGELLDFNLSLVVPDNTISITDGGIAPLGKKRQVWIWSLLEAFANQYDIDLEKPISLIPGHVLNKLLYGTEEIEDVNLPYTFAPGKEVSYKYKFQGILPSLWNQYESSTSSAVRRNLENFMSSHSCKECHGGRLKKESLSVFINDLNIYSIISLDISSALELFKVLDKNLNNRDKTIANLILKEINSRLIFLKDVGLSYLQLQRPVRTLSGGEAQRIRLASQIGSQLVGIMYILDEPSIGLHQHDNNKLINSLLKLRDLGNTVIVVEHDKAMIENADYVIDMGPGAGVNGGNVILTSPPQDFLKLNQEDVLKSLTAQYLTSMKNIEAPAERRQGNGKWLELKGASGNNLKDINLRIPLGLSVCITGMSGSGKSSVINDTLYPILSKHFYNSNKMPLEYDTIEGLEYIDKVIEIDQSPIGRTPRSNPVTYTGIFTLVRDFFAMLPESKVRGYKAGRFSFNVEGGRCESCEGAGIKKIEMNFLPEVYVKCDDCDGKRYNAETLMVHYKGTCIAVVVDVAVVEALAGFSEIPTIRVKLQTLNDVGLGYITLGQQAPTLSGGEAQRVKLATELAKVSTGKTLYLLDEPTTGLHFEDIRILLKLLNKLVDKGNTIIIIEHNLDVIKCADWIIDLGPEGGANGGKIIAEGPPEVIIKVKKSYTGQYLLKENIITKKIV